MRKDVLLLGAWLLIGPGPVLTPEAAAENEPDTAARSSPPAAHAGRIEGTVKYNPDPASPWRFSRYYIRNPANGLLAEAVVTLEGETLPSGPSKDAPVTRHMDQIDFQFVPETMAIRAGDSVRFTNSDDALHNVMTADGGKPFNRSISKGREFVHRFDQAGNLKNPVQIGCIFHGGMRAWIYVFDHPWFHVTGSGGRFDFDNLPPGRYTLEVVHPAGHLRERRQIEVKPGTTAAVEIPLSPANLIDTKATNN